MSELPSKQQRFRELEQALKDLMTDYFYRISPNSEARIYSVLSVSYVNPPEMPFEIEGRLHNYQRDYIQANKTCKILYGGRCICYLDRYPKRQVRIPKRPQDDRGYFAQKVLEKLLYYKFNQLEVIRHE